MSLLAIIWWVSVAMACAALLLMACLVLARLISARAAKRRRARRRALSQQLIGGTAAADLTRVPVDLLSETYVELIRLVRGDERDALVAQAIALGVREHLGRQLRRGAPRERLLATQALREFPDEDSQELVRAALDDPNADVRLAAALALAEGGRAGSVRDLVDYLQLGSAQDTSLAVSLFRSISSERAEEIKALVTAPDTNVRVRLAALEALAMTGDYSLVPILTRLSIDADDDAPELPGYLRALGMLAHPAARPAILNGLGRRSFAARAAAAGAVGRIGLFEFAGRLANMLDDREWWVRFRAAEALLKLGDPGIEWLRRQAREGSPQARSAAASMLAEHQVAP